jgi:tetrathionate reductase subunit A
VSFSLGHAHWDMGSSDTIIDGQDRRREEAIHAAVAMWLDHYLRNTCLLDPIGGSASLYDTKARLEKVKS